MPSNNTGYIFRDLYEKYSDKLALLLNPRNVVPHQLKYPHALDNDCFNQFNENQYFKVLEKLRDPIFITCPDVVGCHDRTLALWNYYYPKLKEYGFPIAFVAQNGCTPEAIPKNADWIFVGGKDPWKMENIHRFVGNGKPVAVLEILSGESKQCYLF